MTPSAARSLFFAAGISASGPASIAHGIVGDLFSVEERIAPMTSLNIAINISKFTH